MCRRASGRFIAGRAANQFFLHVVQKLLSRAFQQGFRMFYCILEVDTEITEAGKEKDSEVESLGEPTLDWLRDFG